MVKDTLIHILLAMVALSNLELEQLDVKTTFLYDKLEDIYMQHEDFVVEGKGHMWKLKKSPLRTQEISETIV